MQGKRIVASETRFLTSATSSQFIMRAALKEEGGLFGPMRKLMLTGLHCVCFSGSEMSWVVSASVLIHPHCRATARLMVFLKGGGRQIEGIYKGVSRSCKSKCCFRSGRLTERRGWVFRTESVSWLASSGRRSREQLFPNCKPQA